MNDRFGPATPAASTIEQNAFVSDVITLAVGDVVRIASANTTSGTNTNSLIYVHAKVTKVA